MYLFSSELAAKPAIRAEVDVAAELPLICGLANKFLGFFSPAPAQAKIYDEELSTLVKKAGSTLRAEVAERLAHVAQGPKRTVLDLAYDPSPAVAVPVLRYSPLIPDRDLVAIAKSCGQDQLNAIAGRRYLPKKVTDIVTARGNNEVLRTVAHNDTAHFSTTGLRRLAHAESKDSSLYISPEECVG